MAKQSSLTAARLRELLSYDPETGQFRWRVARGHAPAGKLAGAPLASGYRQIGIDHKLYYAHRLAWLYTTGRWPIVEIDHRNAVAGDDRWCNLREATRSQNCGNFRRHQKNQTGFKGVTFDKATGTFRARIRSGQKNVYLGCFDSPEEAHRAYMKAATRVFGPFCRAA